MKNEPSWPVYAVPLVGAAVSVLGAMYVGWRQRRLNQTLTRFQTKVAEEVFRRQLCLAFSSKAHVVMSRASEVNRMITAFAQLQPKARQRELERKTERLDRACDGFLEAWSDLLSAELTTPALVRSVDDFTEELEAARLQMLMDDMQIHDDGLLANVIDCAQRCHSGSSALAALYADSGSRQWA